jgi:hypothetical protein
MKNHKNRETATDNLDAENAPTMVKVEVTAWISGRKQDKHLFTYTTRNEVDDPGEVLDAVRDALFPPRYPNLKELYREAGVDLPARGCNYGL